MSQKADSPGKRYNPVEVRRRLLEAAGGLFAREGFAATSVEHIATTAGVTKGAVYHHFANKEDILRVLYEDYLTERTERCASLIATTDEPREQMVLLIYDVFATVLQTKGILGLFLRERELLSKESFSEARAVQRRFYNTFEQVIRDGQSQGVFRGDLDPRHTTYTIMGALVWSEYWYDASRSTSEHFIHDTALLLLDGLSSDAARPERDSTGEGNRR